MKTKLVCGLGVAAPEQILGAAQLERRDNRAAAVPAVPCGGGRLAGVVHRPVELLSGALPAGSGARGHPAVRAARPLGGPHHLHRADLPLEERRRQRRTQRAHQVSSFFLT
jgi:hypothetical protein